MQTIKLLTVGSSGVGKTSMILRFADGTFSDSYIHTVGLDFKTNVVEVDGERVKLQIWDTAGQERFHTLTKSYFNSAHGVILVYDITSEASFAAIERWARDVAAFTGKRLSMLLVGNKVDLEAKRVVSTQAGRDLAGGLGVPFFETSAKDNIGVAEPFVECARRALGTLRGDKAPAGGGGGGGGAPVPLGRGLDPGAPAPGAAASRCPC